MNISFVQQGSLIDWAYFGLVLFMVIAIIGFFIGLLIIISREDK